MPLPGKSGANGTADVPFPLIVLAADLARGGDIVAPLEARGYRIQPVFTPEEASGILREARPALLILTEAGSSGGGAWADVRTDMRGMGIPVLDIVEDGRDPDDLIDHSGEACDWVFRSRVSAELPARAERLIRRSENGNGASQRARLAPLDSHFIALLVHDLRTPLNVIGLSLRMIDQAIPRGDPEVEEDLRFVEENFKQLERMLTQLSDYYRLFEPELQLSETDFSPKRLLDELLEMKTIKASSKTLSAHSEIREDCPEVVALDPLRARTAIEYALSNAAAAAGVGRVRVVMRGAPGRWIVEVRLDQPTPSSVQAHDLHPHRFERLCGSAAERRGMELAIVARVSQMFGGSARLDVEEGKGSAIVLDWPTRLGRS
jgi:signal transduction histidine kinase